MKTIANIGSKRRGFAGRRAIHHSLNLITVNSLTGGELRGPQYLGLLSNARRHKYTLLDF